jgi:hypothetical protein
MEGVSGVDHKADPSSVSEGWNAAVRMSCALVQVATDMTVENAGEHINGTLAKASPWFGLNISCGLRAWISNHHA